MMVPLARNAGFRPGILAGSTLQGMLVIGDDARPGFFGERDRHDLGLERAAFHRLARAGQRLHRIGVLRRAGELIGLRGASPKSPIERPLS